MTVETVMRKVRKEADRVIRSVLEQQALQLSADAVALTVWQDHTGKATASLRVGDPNNVLRITKSNSLFTLEFGSSLPYFRYLEEGTTKTPARPALAPAFDRLEERVMERVMDELTTALQQLLQ